MYGCPYGYIYNSAATVAELRRDPKFSYEPDVIVTRARETTNGIRVEGYNRLDRSPVVVEACRAYLAAGVIPSTQILLRSMGVYDRAVLMKDSQYFLVPLVLRKSSGSVRDEALHTLSQLFVEIFDTEVSPHTVHLQIYSYNDLIGQAVSAMLGPLRRPLDFVARAAENRLMVVQGYLHSDYSSQIAVALRRQAAGPDRLRLEVRPNSETRPMIKRVLRKLMHHAGDLGGWPLPFMLQVAEAGRGFHSGGTFPMRAAPGDLETDVLGRPKGWQRLHVVDSSVFPSIPATTITFSVMANARRIGWETVSIS